MRSGASPRAAWVIARGRKGLSIGNRSSATCSAAAAPAFTQEACSSDSMPGSGAGSLLGLRGFVAGAMAVEHTPRCLKLAYSKMRATDMDFDRYDHVRPIKWEGTVLHLLDQRVLPFRVEYVECRDSHQVSEAI